jgi:DNA helicase-2/ATP-dependent DNA helicase PcrA
MTIAGAGTGKTQILAVRIAKILRETQIDPFNILCLTFTDAGVTAMRTRLIEIIGPAAYHIKVCTFHGFCNEIIKENPDVFIFKQEAEQLDDLERVELFQEIIDELGVMSPIRPAGAPYTYLKDLIDQIQHLKKENIDPLTLTVRLDEMEVLLRKLQEQLDEILKAKRTFPLELMATAAPEKLSSLLASPTPFQQNYLDYLSKKYQEYQNSLTGQKRQDNSAGTKLRNILIDLIEKGLDSLPKQRELARAYGLYQQKLTEKGCYDYDDMIMMVVRALTGNAGLLRKYQEVYQYILVDEYQDTNSAQNQTVDLLGNYFQSPNIFVVGDDDQSIYRFQGASVENIIDFYTRYQQEIKLVTLIRNYRSQQTILDAAGTLIKSNSTRIASAFPNISKDLQSQTSHQAKPVKLLVYATEQSEIFGTAMQIQKLIADGVNPSDIAVLYHKHREAEELTELFLKLKIPFELKAGQNILQDLQISKLITLFRLIDNPNDDEAFSQTLFLDFLGFDKMDVLKFANFFHHKGLGRQHYSWFTAIGDQRIMDEARLANPKAWTMFRQHLVEWKEQSVNLTLPEFFTNVLDQSKYLRYQLLSGQKIETLNRLKSLYKEIKKQTRRNHALTITRFLEQLKARREHDLKLVEEPLTTARRAVQLMTAHGAKGLEFEQVFMINCTNQSWDKEGKWDKIRLPLGLVKNIITDSKKELEEDNRRLFYVAMTRAKKELHISYGRERYDNGKSKENLPTIYLNEIPRNLLEEIDTSEYDNNLPGYLETIFQGKPVIELEEQEIAHFRYLTEHLVLSPTALNSYLTCPRKFFYQNMIRLPQAKSPAQAMGTAIHKALELFLNQYRKTKINPGKEFLLLHFQKALQRELLSQKDYDEKLKYGRGVIGDYIETRGELLASNLFSEINFSSHGVTVEGIPVTGKIDKLGPDPDRPDTGLIVADFKTGNSDRGMDESREGKDYWRQMVFYKILADHSPQFKKTYGGREVTKSQLEFLEKSRKSGHYQVAEIEVTPAAVAEVTENIKTVHRQIRDLQFEKIDRSDSCDRCPFLSICWEN